MDRAKPIGREKFRKSPLLLSRTAPSVFLSDRLSSQFSLPGDLILSLLVGVKLSTL